ncbi:hypothetical protein HanIR_Chr02g0059911 [Helianthus annuus]|nr:hypothetical protein HanIR_Chr02g0059911 [Helianthus annuus]
MSDTSACPGWGVTFIALMIGGIAKKDALHGPILEFMNIGVRDERGKCCGGAC